MRSVPRHQLQFARPGSDYSPETARRILGPAALDHRASGGFVSQTHVLDVFDDTDNFVVACGIAITHIDEHMCTQRFLIAEESTLQSLIDHDDTRRVVVVAIA